ncbi:MAG: hypothetical protein LBM96_11975 [Methanobrevibacter sp.]|jgi:hypothetical protein|nr:hypothetical protein [Candidatus Methanoflexus mossambicus]
MLLAIAIVSINGVSAENINFNGDTVTVDNVDDGNKNTNSEIISISASSLDVNTKTKKINAFNVLSKQNVRYQVVAKYGDKALTINKVKWKWSDGKKSTGKTVNHKFTGKGWKTLTITLNATGRNINYMFGETKKINWINAEKTFNIYVEDKADLVVTKLTQNVNSRNGNIHSLTVEITNQGTKNIGKTLGSLELSYKKLNRTVKAWVPSIKAGKTKTFTVNLPIIIKKSWRNVVYRTISLNLKNISEAIYSNNIIRFVG